MREDFAIFILTHGRADAMVTYNTLKNLNYTGKLYFIIDDEDKTRDRYFELFGKENVIVFNKEEILERVDTIDNFRQKAAILYARHACFDIAKDLGLKYFLQLDDDYSRILYRYVSEDGKFKGDNAKPLSKIIDLLIDFMEKTKALTVAFAQGGDFIGGPEGRWKKGLIRKAMNTFFCKTDNPIPFRGTMNEDVSMYTDQGQKGSKIFTITNIAIVQKETQSLEGGMTDLYKDGGTYLKTFYSVITSPSCVKVSQLNTNKSSRIHHRISWDNATPCIVDEKHRKRSANV